MILTLAFRNLFHDRVRLAVTLVGILFSIVLVAVQLGLYFGASKIITANIDHANADLFITIYGAKSFEDGGMLLTPRERHQALATPGVKAVIPLVVKFAEWRKPAGGSSRVVVVGSDAEDGGLEPWDLVKGTWQDIKSPEAVAVDRTYLNELGIKGVGDTAQIQTGRVRVRALTDGIRSFTQSPYAYTTLNRARTLLGESGDATTFYLVQLQPGADVQKVRQRPRKAARGRRGADQAGVPRPQPQAVAVPHRRRRGADRRRPARQPRRHRDRRPDALFQHQGPLKRVCDLACIRVIGGIYSPGYPGAGRYQRGDRLPARHLHRAGRARGSAKTRPCRWS